MAQIFLSHTKADKDFLDELDRRIFGRLENMKAFRSEFETIPPPGWLGIKQEIQRSLAMFLVIGPELARLHERPKREWEYTQNWIAFEVGVACQTGKDVWVVCDDTVVVNFPVPYFNNYILIRVREDWRTTYGWDIGLMQAIVNDYSKGRTFPLTNEALVECPYHDCLIRFNFHNGLPPGGTIVCPQCLRTIEFVEGFAPFQQG